MSTLFNVQVTLWEGHLNIEQRLAPRRESPVLSRGPSAYYRYVDDWKLQPILYRCYLQGFAALQKEFFLSRLRQFLA
ncbi:hypothetical protein KIN20_017701 [Parelaphostrongylus tenuis]|uniref:Uncharacterized protein n=1 Tax=Parelaphostrongylus tenuis TaxID=148309 RepID=A0AAD5MNL9_PARTN|nr:hypothetical protein KIN20_017701 [Parelaphostrongylus tenuis]